MVNVMNRFALNTSGDSEGFTNQVFYSRLPDRPPGQDDDEPICEENGDKVFCPTLGYCVTVQECIDACEAQ